MIRIVARLTSTVSLLAATVALPARASASGPAAGPGAGVVPPSSRADAASALNSEALSHYLTGRLLEERGLDTDALEEYRQELQLDPGHLSIELRVSEILARLGDGRGSLDHARRALHLFKQYAMAQRFGQFYSNINRKFQARGMAAASATLQSEFGLPVEPAQEGARAEARLPGSCPKCGAPVHSDEVEWIDARSAECPYCGTVLRAD